MTKAKTLNLTYLLGNRVHLTGFDCQIIRALRQLQASCRPPWYNGPRIEFWQESITNPAKVRCLDCYLENPEVRTANTGRVVIDVRSKR